MLINEIETKVGLTKKSIRYYEEEGLLSVKRNKNNSYRQYTMDDVNTLKLIKFLRQLNVPINDIKKLKNKELLLKDCMLDRIKKITEEEKNFKIIKNMCYEIANNEDNYDTIDISKYYLVMNILNKKGFTMKEQVKTHQKKILGACLSSLIFILFFLFFIGLFTYFRLIDNSFPLALYIFLIILFIFPILGIIINLIKRIKEIKGGEEDEASKY